MMGRRRSLSGSRSLRQMALAGCCALGFGWFWNAPALVVPAVSAQPDVPNSAPREAGNPMDSTMIARRILRWESEDLFVDERRLDLLGREIGTVLGAIRDRYPAMREVHARRPPASLRLEIKGRLLYAIAGRLSAGAVSRAGDVLLPVGHAAFDDLGARLGLRTLVFLPRHRAVILDIPERAKPSAVVRAYRALAGVAEARFEPLLFEVPDIVMDKLNGVWHVVMHEARGDCPSGCLYRQTHFFTVESGRVEKVEEATAWEMRIFWYMSRSVGRGSVGDYPAGIFEGNQIPKSQTSAKHLNLR